MSYCPLFKNRFPDFSRLCFHISEWKLVASFHMKSYRSSSTFVMVDLIFHELLPFVKKSFSGLFFAMLSHIWMKVGSKLSYEELQIKFDFRHGWSNFSRVIAHCLKIVFRTFLGYAFTYIWMKVGSKLPYEELQIKFDFVTVDLIFMSYCPLLKNRFPDFSRLCFLIYEWKLVACFHMKSYIWRVTDQVRLSSRLI